MTDALYTLTEEEKIRLAAHEEVIDDGLNTFHKVGMALLDIRDNRLYRQDYRTFEDYCQARWGMVRRHADRLIEAATISETLRPIGLALENEAQVRTLKQFPEELRPAIVQIAKAEAETFKKPLTSGMIERTGEVVVQAANHGVVDINGEATAFTGALSETEFEAHLRRIQYMHDAAEKKSDTVIDAAPDMEDHGGFTDHDEEDFRMGRQKPKTNRAGDKYIPQRQDLCQTPPYALDPLLPYLSNEWTIWEPACGEGLLVEGLYDSGIKSVVSGDIQTGQNFFEYTPEYWDCLVTNPPFSIKYDWLEHCYELQKPFALLIPVETLGAKTAQVLFRQHGIEVIFLDQRINFKMPNKGWDGNGAQFPVAWFTWGLNIGQQMVFASVRRNGEL